jgi:dTDP-4-dehydrorhamnose reductase
MKILITGSDGLMGTNIVPDLAQHFDIIPATENQWDILDERLGEEIIRLHQPDVLINLAAITNVDGCEDAPELAYRVNAEGAGILADLCTKQNVRLVHLSTDYVFDGTSTTPYTEHDRTNPLSIYGRSKLLGEQKVLERHPSSLVVRTEWVYGKGGDNFITKVTKIAREKGGVAVPVPGLSLPERFFRSCRLTSPANRQPQQPYRGKRKGLLIRCLTVPSSKTIRASP